MPLVSIVWIYTSKLISVFLGRFVDLKCYNRVVMFVVAEVKGLYFKKGDIFGKTSFL